MIHGVASRSITSEVGPGRIDAGVIATITVTVEPIVMDFVMDTAPVTGRGTETSLAGTIDVTTAGGAPVVVRSGLMTMNGTAATTADAGRGGH